MTTTTKTTEELLIESNKLNNRVRRIDPFRSRKSWDNYHRLQDERNAMYAELDARKAYLDIELGRYSYA